MSETGREDLITINNLLKEKLLRRLPETGLYPTAIEGFMIARHHAAKEIKNCVYKPLVAVIIQGSKRSIIGSEEYRYGENQCLIVGVDVPSANHVITASPERPFLAVALDLDQYLVTQLAAEVPPSAGPGDGTYNGVAVAEVDPDLLSAFLRLLNLLDRPEQIPVLAPMIIREIHYRLLIGPQSGLLRRINTLGTQSNQIARAVTWLRDNYKEPLQVDELARKVNMATSTFHRHFRQVTTLSPLQFQKRLRLFEAQRLMLVEDRDASIAAITVGYESPTQFNREYKRMFGDPPHTHINRLK
ncbi:MAG: rhaS 1 [Deltaproteobacteria bacterium]|nr:rhaS 1 [Deltaproteobacteria bacterium]